MDFKKELYEIKFTEICKQEIFEIYEYISKKYVLWQKKLFIKI